MFPALAVSLILSSLTFAQTEHKQSPGRDRVPVPISEVLVGDTLYVSGSQGPDPWKHGSPAEHLYAARLSTKAAEAQELTPSAEEVARAAGLLSDLQRLQELMELPPDPANAGEALSLRQEILEGVMSSSLEVDATIAQIDDEIAHARELRDYLADKRDRTVNLFNLSSITAGGVLGIVSSALQLSPHLARTGLATGIVSGGTTSALSIMGLKAQKGEERRFTFPSNMLAKLFDRPLEENSDYPFAVWQFITSVAATDPDKITRQERLIRTWVEVKRIDPPHTPKAKAEIERVTSRPSDGCKLTIDDLDNRIAMLQDLRAKLLFMKRDLGLLLQTLPKYPAAPICEKPDRIGKCDDPRFSD